MKIVLNKCYGGFSISREAAEHMAAAGCQHAARELEESKDRFYGYGYAKGYDSYDRANPYLVAAVEALGEKANGWSAALEVVEIPDGADYEIDEYDGKETARQRYDGWFV